MARRVRCYLQYSQDGAKIVTSSDYPEARAEREYERLERRLKEARRPGSFVTLYRGREAVREWQEDQLALTLSAAAESIQRHVDREGRAA